MAILTIEVSDDLMEKLAPIHDQLPALLHQCLQPSALTARVYRYILDFLTSQPTPEQVAAFRPTQEMQDRLKYLLSRSGEGDISPEEVQELDAYEQIEHLMVLLKSGTLPYLATAVEV